MGQRCYCEYSMMYKRQGIILLLFTLTTIVVSSNVNLENLDIESLLNNEGQREAAFACLMDQKPCGELQGLRDILAELIETKCSQCSPKQKQKYDHVSKVLLEKHPKIFNALALKYSPKEQA